MVKNFEGLNNNRAKEEKESLNMSIVHSEELHDQNEDIAGEKINLATGKMIDNSSDDPGAPETFEIEDNLDEKLRKEMKYEDAMPPIIEEDAAEIWLQENDPKHPLYRGKN